MNTEMHDNWLTNMITTSNFPRQNPYFIRLHYWSQVLGVSTLIPEFTLCRKDGIRNYRGKLKLPFSSHVRWFIMGLETFPVLILGFTSLIWGVPTPKLLIYPGKSLVHWSVNGWVSQLCEATWRQTHNSHHLTSQYQDWDECIFYYKWKSWKFPC